MKERPYQIIINTNGNITKQKAEKWNEVEKIIVVNKNPSTDILVIDNNGKYQYAYSSRNPKELIAEYKKGGII